MKIRIATIDDAEKLALIGSETFWDAYRAESALESKYIRAYMSKAFSLTTIRSELNDTNTSFLLASHQEKDAGYAKLCFSSKHESLNGMKPMEIARIYLVKALWGKGLGGDLLDACFDQAKSSGCDSVWLGVWKRNNRAIRFYEKHGFEIVGEIEFDLASSLQLDHVMERLFRKKAVG